MTKKDSRRLMIAWGLVVLSLLFVLLTSCKVMKGKEEKEMKVVKADSTITGHVSETKSTTNTDWEWFKTTLQYIQQPKDRDTIINKNYYTANTPQPQVIIMEGGKGKQEVQASTYDSTWDKRFARLEAIVSESSKTKKVEGFSTMQLLAGALCIVALSVLASKLTFKK